MVSKELSAPRTPQQNDIDERRNRSTVDCARTLLIEKGVVQYFLERNH